MSALHATCGCMPAGQATIPAYGFPSQPLTPSGYSDYTSPSYAPYNAGDDARRQLPPLLADNATRDVAMRNTPPSASTAATAYLTSAAEQAELPPDFEPRAPERAWKYLVIHHSATADGDVRSIDGDHRGRTDRDCQPWLGIGYHFVIGNGGKMGDGEVEATFRWRDQLQGAHAGASEFNELGIGICLIGDFDHARPTPKQMAALEHLSALLSERYGIPRANRKRHGDVNATECPGRLFPWAQYLSH